MVVAFTNVKCALALATVAMLAACDAAPQSEQAGQTSSSAAASVSAPAAVPATPQATTACADARVEFGPVHKSNVLTAVAPVATVTSRTGGRLTTALRPVRRYRAEVVAVGNAPQADIYRAFASELGDPAPTAELGEVAPVEAGAVTVQGPGRFVRYRGVRAVQATFSYSCGPITDRGTVSSWLIAITGVLSCDRKPQPAEPIHTEAMALVCRK
jgi:hypothetical protein